MQVQFGDWIPFSFLSLLLSFHKHTFNPLWWIQSVDVNIAKFSDNEIVELLLYGSPKFNSDQNHKTLRSWIIFVLKFERFDGLLL